MPDISHLLGIRTSMWPLVWGHENTSIRINFGLTQKVSIFLFVSVGEIRNRKKIFYFTLETYTVKEEAIGSIEYLKDNFMFFYPK